MISIFKFRPSKGFTLLELLVVMILIALASSLVAVNIARSGKESAFKSFKRDMVGICRQARRLALKNGDVVVAKISSTRRKCWIEGVNSVVTVPEEMLIEGEGISLVDEDTYGVRFFPDGSSSGGILSFSVGGTLIFEFQIDMLTSIIQMRAVDEEG